MLEYFIVLLNLYFQSTDTQGFLGAYPLRATGLPEDPLFLIRRAAYICWRVFSYLTTPEPTPQMRVKLPCPAYRQSSSNGFLASRPETTPAGWTKVTGKLVEC